VFGRFVQQVVGALKIPKAQFSVFFMKDRSMARLHHRWLGAEKAADVLSLEYSGTPAGMPADPLGVLGDVAVSVDEARRKAKELGIPVSEELGRYTVHGILHCLGYNDRLPAERGRMWRLQERILGRYKKILFSILVFLFFALRSQLSALS
jgi:probable rRNA maturation factor